VRTEAATWNEVPSDVNGSLGHQDWICYQGMLSGLDMLSIAYQDWIRLHSNLQTSQCVQLWLRRGRFTTVHPTSS
jgi:hypothetical protein